MGESHFNQGRKRPDLAAWNRANKTSTVPLLQRLAQRSVADGACLLWAGATLKGYGCISVGGETVLVHRAAWIERHGPIPAETPHVLHHCDRPLCWADAHLYVGTPADNMRDRISRGRNPNGQKTHCKAGHPYDAVNTYVRATGARGCRACRRVGA